MDKSVPAAAALILNKIGSIEAPQGYNTVYGNNQNTTKWNGRKPLVEFTIDELIAEQRRFTTEFGSSAAGKYQIMRDTLIGLKKKLKLSGKQKFDANLQDRLAYDLLRQRGYARWVKDELSNVQFGLAIAQEWASFPVLAATKGAHRQVTVGQSYYAGDGKNKAMIPASAVLQMLQDAKGLTGVSKGVSGKALGGAAAGAGAIGVVAGVSPTTEGQSALQQAGEAMATARPIIEGLQYLGTLPTLLLGAVILGAVGYGVYRLLKK